MERRVREGTLAPPVPLFNLFSGARTAYVQKEKKLVRVRLVKLSLETGVGNSKWRRAGIVVKVSKSRK